MSAITALATGVGSSVSRSRGRRRFTPASSRTFGSARFIWFRVDLGHLEGTL
jgi:hypothetical protein